MTDFKNSFAYIIGINEYQYISPLQTAVNDASRIAEILEKNHGYQAKLLLNCKLAELKELLDKTLPSQTGKDDRILIYFAGHGIANDSPDDNAEPAGFLVPADADTQHPETLLAMDYFHEKLNELACRHLLLILDCCFAGSFKWAGNTRNSVLRLPKKIYQERFDRYLADSAWQVITSSAYDQKALDILHSIEKPLGKRAAASDKHSPFALALFEALEGKADVIPADANDGLITASELYMFLRDKVEKQTLNTSEKLRQTPGFFPLKKHDKGEYIFFSPNHVLNLPAIPKRNPYKGLQSFNESDSDYFYGREKVAQDLLDKVLQNPLTVVTGASGTGKSSLVKAGVLPNLRELGYEILPVIRPTMNPETVLNEQIPLIQKHLEANKKIVQIVDQYEELITQCHEEAQRSIFINTLRDYLKNPAVNLKIILTIRSDFEPQFEKLGLEDYWFDARFTVPAFSQAELRDIIEKPALQEVLYFEPPELVETIINEVIQAPGALPLLSFTLSELYEKCYKEGRILSEKAYKELGGVIGSLRTRADNLYESLDATHQNTMRKIMLRLVSLEGGELASRRVLLPELEFEKEEENQKVKHIIEKLVETRLVVQGKDNNGENYIEPAHDALVRAWAKLWEWIKFFGEENIALQRRLGEAVKEFAKI